MAKFDDAEVHKLAKLAHVSLTDEERASFREQLEKVLGYAERIQALDTSDVEPTSHALLEAGLEGGTQLRDDHPRESLDRDAVLERAPDASDGLFKVPKVLP